MPYRLLPHQNAFAQQTMQSLRHRINIIKNQTVRHQMIILNSFPLLGPVIFSNDALAAESGELSAGWVLLANSPNKELIHLAQLNSKNLRGRDLIRQ